MERAIYYFAASMAKPRGGIKQIYRHVDVLRRAGRDATVVHVVPGFRATWFDNTTEVIDRTAFTARFRTGHDFVVLSEDLGLEIDRWPRHRRVIFNQNVYYGFASFGEDVPEPDPYASCDAVLTVSDHSAELLRFAYPQAHVHRVVCGVDGGVFKPRPLADKRRRIACIATKASTATLAVFQAMSARARAGGPCADVEWVFIRDQPQSAVAEILASSRAVVFCSVEEGFGLVPLEGLLSGCIVLTHGNGPQREYMPPEMLIGEHDVAGMVRALEAVFAADGAALASWQRVCDDARMRLAETYALAREEASVLAAWSQIIERAG